MKIYGVGTFKAPGTNRVIWDFSNGPFDCVNPVFIEEARRRGYSFKAPLASQSVKVALPKDTPRKRGRPAKGKANVNAKINEPG